MRLLEPWCTVLRQEDLQRRFCHILFSVFANQDHAVSGELTIKEFPELMGVLDGGSYINRGRVHTAALYLASRQRGQSFIFIPRQTWSSRLFGHPTSAGS